MCSNKQGHNQPRKLEFTVYYDTVLTKVSYSDNWYEIE